MSSIASLRKQIAREKDRIAAMEKKQEARMTVSNLQSELRRLKRPAAYGRVGNTLMAIGRKVGPQVLKQARLIKAQQIRDQKSLNKASRRAGRIKVNKSSNPFGMEMADLDF